MNADDLIRLLEAAASHGYAVEVDPSGKVSMKPGKTTGAMRTAAYRMRQQDAAAIKPPPAEQQVPKPRRTTYGPDPEACAVEVDASLDGSVRAMWGEYQKYRQAKASAPTASLRQPWTAQAARLAAAQVEKFTKIYGAQIISDRIATAIAAGWQGLNFDKLDNANHRPTNRTPSRNPVGTKKADPALDGDFLPGDF